MPGTHPEAQIGLFYDTKDQTIQNARKNGFNGILARQSGSRNVQERAYSSRAHKCFRNRAK